MDNEQLYNCCTNHAAPDWTLFDGLEIAAMLDFGGFTEDASKDDVPDFYCIFGHLKVGGCEPITDCKSRWDATSTAEELRHISGLPVIVRSMGKEV